jgi:lysozyme
MKAAFIALVFVKGVLIGSMFLSLAREAPTAAPTLSPIVVGLITSTSPVSMPIRTAAKAMLRQHEGERAIVYRDSEGNPTIGVGFNLTRPDADKRLRQVKTTKARILAGEILTPDQTDWLLESDLTDVLQDLITLLPRFVDMPQKAQLVLIDLRFNCGPGGLRTFVNTLKDMHAARYDSAAARLASSRWASQVGSRADRAVIMLRGIS